MICEVIGIKKGSFQDRTTGKTIYYCRVYYVYEDEKTDGMACGIEKIAYQDSDNIKVGDKVEFLYNRYGKVDSIVKR